MSKTELPTKYDVIEPHSGWRFLNVKEIWDYRDLVYFLFWRDVKARYAQSVLGFAWAFVQPIFMMIVFTVIFGRLVEVNSDGIPYPLFSYSALVPWVFFSGALAGATGSLPANRSILNKVYFPRTIIPLSTVSARTVDLFIAFLLVAALMVYYRQIPTGWIVVIPLLVMLAATTALGMGLWLTALAVRYRDVQYGLSLVTQGMMYLSPVVYPVSLVPERFRFWYGLNPMTGVIEGIRSALTGAVPMPWDLIATGSVVTALIFVSGSVYFRRMERVYADVV